jgi:hypothetical protein
MLKRFLAVAATILLSACAADEPRIDARPLADDSYTPTGSNIPRKTVDKDGSRVILSRDGAERLLETATPGQSGIR